jgi:hypothetical protein
LEKSGFAGEIPLYGRKLNPKSCLFASRLNATIYYSKIMTTKREMIEAKAIELLKSNPDGMRTSQL